MQLRIPEKDQSRLALLLQLSANDLAALKSAIVDASPNLKSSKFSADIESKVSIEQTTVREVVRLLLSLYTVQIHENLSPAAMVDEVCAFVKRQGANKLPPPIVGWEHFAVHLTGMLSAERSLGVTVRAALAAFHYPSHLHQSRIVTDARPVFLTSPQDGPSAFIVMHSLSMDVHQDEEDRQWFVALNSKDLRALREAIDRALASEDALYKSLEKTGLTMLRWSDGDE